MADKHLHRHTKGKFREDESCKTSVYPSACKNNFPGEIVIPAVCCLFVFTLESCVSFKKAPALFEFLSLYSNFDLLGSRILSCADT